jgi:hypothetical protein
MYRLSRNPGSPNLLQPSRPIQISVVFALPLPLRLPVSINSEKIRWAELVTRMGERRGAKRDWVRKAKSKKPLGKCKSRWENNVKMDVKEIE